MNDEESPSGLRRRLMQSEDARVFAESALETVRQALLVLDGNLRVVYANRLFYNSFAVQRAETEGELVYRLGNGQWDIPALRQLLDRVVPTGDSFEDFSVRHRFENIGERLMYLNARPIRQEGGRETLVLLAIEDVTERERAERALHESEHQYRTLVESINSIIIRADENGRITFINHFAEEVFGIGRGEWMGEKLFGNVIPCPDDDCAGVLKRILSDPEPFYINESRILRPDGKAVFFSWSAKGVRDEAGRVTEILIDGNDMSPMAEYRQRLDDALSLLDASPDPTALLDAQDRPTFVNGAFERVIAAGQPPLPMGRLAADNPIAAMLLRLLARVRETGESLSEDIGTDGRHLHWYALPTRAGDGTVMLFARDVTERDAARQESERTNRALQQRNAELDAFNYSVSHDLRGPLRALAGLATILDEDYGEQLGDSGRDCLRRIDQSAQTMSTLLDGLLTLSRVGRADLAREHVDLSALAHCIIDELSVEYPARTVQVSVESGLTTHADPRLLRTALSNLLGNAWKYTGRVPGASIVFGRCDTPEGAAFYVRDNGVGFDPQRAAELFAPFRRLHSEQEFAGSGIGLATVQRVVHKHGGRIWAEGEPGRGATFYFTLGKQSGNNPDGSPRNPTRSV